MAYLAPDIVQAILDSDVPPECSFDRIKEDLPLDWNAQSERFGFAQNPVRSTSGNGG
jgi:hypothetical protein